jgi:hypothetical protein
MAEEKIEIYSDDAIQAKIKEHALDSWYLEDGWLPSAKDTIEIMHAITWQ